MPFRSFRLFKQLNKPRLLSITNMSHSKHAPFKQVEGEREAFDTADVWKVTKTPSPAWQPGQGGNGNVGLVGVKEGLWNGKGGETKEIDPKTANVGGVYKMMISGITPRPVGFVSSIDVDGKTNLAPFSYFSMCCHNPPMISVSFTHLSATERKDSCNNILATKGFTCNIISEPFIEAANYTCTDSPHDISEWTLSGLTPIESNLVKAPRVGESAFAMECELAHHYDIHNDDGVCTGTVVIGRVRLFHVREDIIDPETMIIDTAKLQPVSRLGGISYGRTTSTFELPRPVWNDEKDREVVKDILAKNEGAKGNL